MSNDGYTGHLFEEEVFGWCLAQPCEYMRWREAVEAVRKNQPRQKPPVATLLEREVSRQVGGRCVFYTAVRSALDKFHGVDGFFELGGRIVTVDLTMNPHKDSSKSDVLIRRGELDDIASLAGRIAREFTTQQRRAGW